MYKLIMLLLSTFTLGNAVAQEEEFLKVDQAFMISGAATDSNTIRVQWDIADGYYLYQSKFRFSTDTPEVVLAPAVLPPAMTKQDPVFGEIEVYRNQVAIEIPLLEGSIVPDVLEIRARSQGCADAGICYPPHTQSILVALNQAVDQPKSVTANAVAEMEEMIGSVAGSSPEVEETRTSADPLQELAMLGDSLGLDDEDDILPADQAFRFFAEVGDGRTLKLRWDIAEATYLYHDQIKINIEAEGVSLGSYQLPEPKVKHDSVKPDGTIGDVAVYYDEINLALPLLRANREATEITLKARYQGCADRGICYPPAKRSVLLQLPAVAEADDPAALAAALSTVAEPEAEAMVSEQDQITSMLQGGSTWLIIASFLGIGLLLAFTPCVFPMIPILSGIIAGQGSGITTHRAFILSLVYVLAMAVTYTVVGILAGLFGSNLQAAFQNPWILSGFSAVFVLLALSMFGFYELQLPSSWQGKLSEISNRQQGGGLIGVGVMGLLSALIVGPCVAPPLAGALIFIGQTGDWVLGGLALFAMSLGMGAPLVAIGTSAGKFLPKAGAWMDSVKAIFGVMMLGIAIFMLERIIPESAAMMLWGTLFIVSAIYMGAVHQLPVEASGWTKLWKGLGLVLLVYGVMFLVGVAAGGKDTLQPLRGILATGGSTQAHLSFKPVKSNEDLDRELAAAAAAGRPVMLDFYADWCLYCKQMEKNTFSDPAVQTALTDFVLLQADVTDQDEADMALMQRIGIPAPPAIIFWGADGREHRNLRLLGYMDAADFANHVNKATP